MLFALDPSTPYAPFPDVEQAETEPDGLLALGGDLSITRLLNAYKQGIFPWYSEGQPILWWSPNPRTILLPARLKVSKSLRKTLRKCLFSATLDHDFDGVISACAEPRRNGDGTWILPEMSDAYRALHRAGYAHSVEIWRENKLVGGLYGVALGRIFFGESMFSRVSNASKIAMVHLANTLLERSFYLLDCQIHSQHLASLGAQEISRRNFVELLNQYCDLPGDTGSWATSDAIFPEVPDTAQ